MILPFLRPKPADGPATIIWDSYELTRRVISVVMAFPAFLCLSVVVAGFVFDPANAPQRVFRDPANIAGLLLGIQGAICVGLARNHFGLGRMACILGISLIPLWLVSAGLIAYVNRGIDLANELGLFCLLSGIVSVTGISIFFLNYLLWRTNSDD